MARTATALFGSTIVLALALAGCASTKPPAAEAIGSAEYALRKAKEDGAAEDAPVIVRKAEDKLARARAAREDEDLQTAVWLAHEVSIEAQIAEATAARVNAVKARDLIRKSVDELRAELERGLER